MGRKTDASMTRSTKTETDRDREGKTPEHFEIVCYNTTKELALKFATIANVEGSCATWVTQFILSFSVC